MFYFSLSFGRRQQFFSALFTNWWKKSSPVAGDLCIDRYRSLSHMNCAFGRHLDAIIKRLASTTQVAEHSSLKSIFVYCRSCRSDSFRRFALVILRDVEPIERQSDRKIQSENIAKQKARVKIVCGFFFLVRSWVKANYQENRSEFSPRSRINFVSIDTASQLQFESDRTVT